MKVSFRVLFVQTKYLFFVLAFMLNMIGETWAGPVDLKYSFDTDEGGIVTDLTGSGNNGVVSGATWVANGVVGGAYSFDGTNDGIWAPTNIYSNVTFSLWFKKAISNECGTTVTRGIFGSYKGGGVIDLGCYWECVGTAPNKIVAAFGSGVPNSVSVITSDPIIDTNWHHLVVVRSGEDVRLFIDGVNKTVPYSKTGTTTGLVATAREFGLGNFNYTSLKHHGLLDEFSVYSRVLSTNEIVALYTNVIGSAWQLSIVGNPGNYGSPVALGYGIHPISAGQAITNQVAEYVSGGVGVRYHCLGWTGTGDVPISGTGTSVVFTVTTNSTLTWLWGTEYYLDTGAGSHGSVDVGDGWHTNGVSVTITATTDLGYHFTSWSGDVPGGQETNNPLTVTMNQARTLTAGIESDTHPIGVDLRYSFDTDEGGTVTDLTGSGNNGTVSGATWVANGIIGGAYYFDGTNDGIWAPTNIYSNVTFSLWFKKAISNECGSSEITRGLFGTYATEKKGLGCFWNRINYEPNKIYTLLIFDDPNTFYNKIGEPIIDTNWHHLVVTRSGSNVNMYVDGVFSAVPELNRGTTTGDVATANMLGIGNFAYTQLKFHGLIDEFSVFGRVLLTNEIVALYTNGIGAAWQLSIVGNPEYHGEPESLGYGTHFVREGQIISNQVAGYVMGVTGIRYRCIGWEGTADVPASGTGTSVVFTVTTNSTLTWLWQTEYYLDTEAGLHGSVDVGDGWYTNGAPVTITASADTGYHFAGWSGDIVSGANPLTLTMTQAWAVTAGFAINQYTINASNSSAGTITPAGATVVDYGSSKAYTIVADTNAHIVELLVDGVAQGLFTSDDTVWETNFINVAANHLIQATFNYKPVPVVMISPMTGSIPACVSFNFAGSTDSDGEVVRCEVDADGNGVFETKFDGVGLVKVDYAMPGVYTPMVRVVDDDSGYGVATAGVVTILGSAPVAGLTATPAAGAAPMAVTLDASGSVAGPGCRIEAYEWDGDGDGVIDLVSTNPTAVWIYRQPGTFNAMVRVTDNTGRKAESTAVVTVSSAPNPPEVVLSVSTNRGARPLDVTFTAAATDDGSVVAYRWDIDGDGMFDLETAANAITGRLAQVGTFHPVVEVQDDSGLTARDAVTVVVTEPTALRVWIVQPKDGERVWGDAVTLNANAVPASKVQAVAFQYRAAGDVDWIDVGDLIVPPPADFKDNWCVTGLVNGAFYEVRAVGYDLDTNEVASTPVTVEIDNTCGDDPGECDEGQGSNGNHYRRQGFDDDGTTDLTLFDGTKVTMPPGTFGADSSITIELVGVNTNPVNGSASNTVSIDANRRVSVDGDPELKKVVTLIVPYLDADNDGFVDGTAIPERSLKVCWFDTEAGIWRNALSSEVFAEPNYVRAQIYHMTEFGVFGSEEKRALVIKGQPTPFGMPGPLGYGTNLVALFKHVTNSVPLRVGLAPGVRMRCLGWSGTGDFAGSGSANWVLRTVSTNSTLTWRWRRQFRLIFGAATNGAISRTSGWFDRNITLTVLATPAPGYRFDRWLGDIDAGQLLMNPVNILMNRARNVVPYFANYSMVAINDLNGDGASDLLVFAGAAGAWYSRSMSGLGATGSYALGPANAVPTAGDFDGDDYVDLATYDKTAGKWYIYSPKKRQMLLNGFNWGFAGAQVACGDYDGDGATDIGLYGQSHGLWFIYSTKKSTPIISGSLNWGFNNSKAVPGDYNGDGYDDLAVFNISAGTWFVFSMKSRTILTYGFAWGFSGCEPVSGDYDGDGFFDKAVYHSTAGKWYIWSSAKNAALAYGKLWGFAGCVPVSGDYDGDGCSDMALYHQASGKWYIWSIKKNAVLSNGTAWGWSGAVPIRTPAN